mmetsp:Transcript_979/g.2483  ORF Transcript_979/g.2483 Transcript_979/m.2483 type:complete len:179 (+) Transcript_979:93-629(+)
MGARGSGLCRRPERQARVVLLGLDAAGKSAVLQRWLSRDGPPRPTRSFDVGTVECALVDLVVWDASGRDAARQHWQHYCEGAEALVWVFDCTDRGRIEECLEEFQRMLARDALRQVPLLVLANKKDIAGSMVLDEVVERLGLHDIKARRWFALSVSASTGEGLQESLDWILRSLASAP